MPSSLSEYLFALEEPDKDDYSPDDNERTLQIGHADAAIELEYQQIGSKKALMASVTNQGIETASGNIVFYDANGNSVAESAFMDLASGDTTIAIYELDENFAGINGGDVSARVTLEQEELYTYNNADALHINDPSHTEPQEVGHVHNLTKVEAVAATCATDGNIEYWTCSECGKVFSDAEGKSEITQDATVVKAIGHDWGEWVVTKPATEDAEGEETRVCKNDASHTETQTIAKLPHEHSLSKMEAVAATCEMDGNIAYWTCSGCGKLFSDADGKTEITQDKAVVKATGHNWGDWSVTKPATEEAEGEETRVCKNDASHTETRTIAKLGTSSSGGCYVATSVYGSYDCPEVWTLRRFRDDVLAQTWYGRLFIRLYYAVSPTAVKWFGDCQWFQNFFRDRLDKMVSGLQADGFESTPYEDRVW